MHIIRQVGVAAVLITGALVATAGPVAADPPTEPNPAQVCRETANADGYLASHGGCASSVATVGIEALMAGAFPSQAAAVANCKAIRDGVGGWPYAFYGNPEWTATNTKTCVDLLKLFHSWQ